MENSLSNSSSINSIINLKILLILGFYQKGTCFKNVQKLVNKSKSQLSVSLGKLERRGLITKTETRPQIVTITKTGSSVAEKALKEINSIQVSNKKKKKRVNIESSRIDFIIQKFLNEYKEILREEMTDLMQFNLISDEINNVLLNISDRIDDKLYNMVNTILSLFNIQLDINTIHY